MSDVLAIGNAIVDVISQETDALLDQLGLIKGSMALCDRDRSDAIYSVMGPGTEMSGGSAANTAVGVASFGGAAAFVGKVDDDQLGQVFCHDIRAAGVQYEPPPAPGNGVGTARCLVLVTPDAQRTLNTYLGVSAELGPADIDEEAVAAAAITYVEGYLWDAPAAKEAIQVAFTAAHRAGQRVAFTLSDAFCVDRHRKEFLDLLEGEIDVLFANEAELLALFEAPGFDEAIHELRGRCELAAVTRSEKGSVLVAEEELHLVDAWPATVVDTTGAGDLYAAGVLYGLTHGHDAVTAGRLGAIAAAEVISHIGARPLRPLAQLAADALAL